jgi:hypothetical protein
MCEERAPATAVDALAAVRSGLEFLATADTAALTVAELADCVRGLAACESVHLAAMARTLGAFSAAGGHAADGQITVRSWLRWQTRSTSAAAGAAAKWMRRLQAHPRIAAGLAAGGIAPSVAREILDWTDKLPDEHQGSADQILLDAAGSGAELSDLSALAEELFRRCARPDADDSDDSFARRRLRLTSHYQGHAHLDADLTPSAAAAVKAVLDSLGRKTGPEDQRTQPQRDHDAMEEGCRRLITGGLPARAGQPTQIQLHMTLSQLLGQPEADQATAAWIAANGTPAPPGADCDSSIAPIVTGTLDQDLLPHFADRVYPVSSATGAAGGTVADHTAANLDAAESAESMAGRAAQQLLVADAAAVLSGPKGLAGWLRTSLVTGPAASVSLPLDIGKPTETVPPWLRKAIALRDKHCGFPGCDVPPEYCHVHHIVPRAEGGTTSLQNCILGCGFHHLIVIHRWGWQLTLNPDGTTTAVHPHGWRTVRSHAPPVAA